jgi:hypothetical protein
MLIIILPRDPRIKASFLCQASCPVLDYRKVRQTTQGQGREHKNGINNLAHKM